MQGQPSQIKELWSNLGMPVVGSASMSDIGSVNRGWQRTSSTHVSAFTRVPQHLCITNGAASLASRSEYNKIIRELVPSGSDANTDCMPLRCEEMLAETSKPYRQACAVIV